MPDHNDYMDELVISLGKELDGVPKLDAASASAMIIAFSLMEFNDREARLQDLIEFIRHVWTQAKGVQQ